jgi:hypothetical protein
MPSLYHLQPQIYSDPGVSTHFDDWWEIPDAGFRFRTYSNGSDTLYHARFKSSGLYDGWFVPILCRHLASYWREDLRQGDPRCQDGSGLYDEWDEEEEFDYFGADQWADLTCFRGHPIPFCLLNYVYSASGSDLGWEQGQRGLQLIGDAWDVLVAWSEECEKVAPRMKV